MKITVPHIQASARVKDVLQAILSSNEWARNARSFPTSDYMDGREPFRRFFDIYEGRDGEDWLGILEWAVLEELRAGGASLIADEGTVTRIIDRLERHPDVSP